MARHTRTIRVTKIASGYRIASMTDGKESAVWSHRKNAHSALAFARRLQHMAPDKPEIVWDASGRDRR